MTVVTQLLSIMFKKYLKFMEIILLNAKSWDIEENLRYTQTHKYTNNDNKYEDKVANAHNVFRYEGITNIKFHRNLCQNIFINKKKCFKHQISKNKSENIKHFDIFSEFKKIYSRFFKLFVFETFFMINNQNPGELIANT